MNTLPQSFHDRILQVFGDQGQEWLERLPSLRETFIKRWALQDCQPVKELSYNYLDYAWTAAGDPVVLKLGLPNPELETEIKTLRHYNGAGMVRLLEADPDLGALLLERVIPGTSLSALESDPQATRIAGKVMEDLWKPAPPEQDFPTVADWCRGFERYRKTYPRQEGPLPGGLVSRAGDLVRELLKSSRDPYLLHGDLHHYNLLYRQDGSWIAIDPKGVIGEPAFEIGAYLSNPKPNLIQRSGLQKILDRRLAILEQVTGLDRHRMASWSFCRAVLSAIWSLEDNQDQHSHEIEIAERLQLHL